MGFSKGWQGYSEGFPKEQPCNPEENPVLPDSFAQIYIPFQIGFRIGPPKMHRWFCIGLPNIHKWFCIDPPKIQRRLVPYWPLLGYPLSSPTRIPQLVNSGVPWLVCKKSNTTSYLK